MVDFINFIVSSLITDDLRNSLKDLSKSNPDVFNFCIALLGVCGTRILFESLSKVKKDA